MRAGLLWFIAPSDTVCSPRRGETRRQELKMNKLADCWPISEQAHRQEEEKEEEEERVGGAICVRTRVNKEEEEVIE